MTRKQELIARIAFYIGFAIVSFIYLDIALDILANQGHNMNENHIYRMTIAELYAMQETGFRVPEQAFELAYSETLSDYMGMSISDIADFLIQLAEVTE